MSDAKLTIDGDLSPYFAELSKLPGVTADAALKAATELRKQQDAIERQAKAAAERIARQAEKAAGNMEEKVADGFASINKTATVIAPALQAITGPLDDTGDLIERVGFAGAASSIGVGALASALIGMVANALDVARSWDQINEQLGKSNAAIVENDSKIREEITALGVLHDQWTELRVELAGEVAPAITRTSYALAGAVDAAEGLARASSGDMLPSLRDVEARLVSTAGAAGVILVPALEAAGLAYDYLADRGESLVDTQESIADAFARTRREIEESSDAFLQQQLAALGMVETPAQESARLAREREAEQAADKARARAEKAAAEAKRQVEARARAADQLYTTLQGYWVAEMDAEDQIIAKRDIDIAKLLELADASGNHATAEEAIQLRIRQAEQETADLRAKLAAEESKRVEANQQQAEKAAAAIAAATAEQAAADRASNKHSSDVRKQAWIDAIGVAQDATDSILGMLDTQNAGQRRAALAVFAIQKGLAIADIAVKTAQSFMAALTIPPPAGEVLGALNVAAGVAAAATVAAQQPSFHAGLFQGRGLASDEVRAVVKTGEVVVPRPMVDRAGGPDAVRSRVDQPMTGGTTVIADFASRRVLVPLRDTIDRSSPVDPFLGWSHGS